jgi:hypothetical protein
MVNQTLSFSETELQRLFGHEAAENEDPCRLKEYYFKSSTYDQVVNDLPLRILVGHKGIGKSALFQIAMQEEFEAGRLTILIKPDDITDLGKSNGDFLQVIRDWKEGITEIIAKKALQSFGLLFEGWRGKLNNYGGMLLDFLKSTFKDATKVNIDPSKKLFISDFLKKGKISIYIDDLDRGWQGLKNDITRISALLNAIRDISTENRGIFFRVSLRSDVYYLVRTSDESTDKIEGSVIWQTWSNHEIFVLLIKRIESFFGRQVDESALIKTSQCKLAHYLDNILEQRFSGVGHWENAPMYRVLMSLIRKRPRDLVKLCTLAGRNARECNDNIIKTINLKNIFEEYSQGRLQDTINEYRTELSFIERLLLGMKPAKKERKTKTGYVYTTDQLLQKINNIREQGELKFANGIIADNKSLAAFLYKINFLTARKETNDGILRKYFEENRYLSNEFVEFGFDWEVHPAYRWALQPENVNDIYNNLALSAD